MGSSDFNLQQSPSLPKQCVSGRGGEGRGAHRSVITNNDSFPRPRHEHGGCFGRQEEMPDGQKWGETVSPLWRGHGETV